MSIYCKVSLYRSDTPPLPHPLPGPNTEGWEPTKKADFAQAGQDHAKYTISSVIWDGSMCDMSEDDKKVK